jgi:nucleoid-associated protein YgaU
MDVVADHIVRLRTVVLWCLTTAAAAAIALVTLPAAAASPGLASGPAFTDLLVRGCAVASLLAVGWLWAITTDVVARVLMTGGRVVVRRPGPVRLLLLTACGAVVLGATAAPASADETRPVAPQSLAGLPLPDRATGDGFVSHPADHTPRTLIRVRPGDSLWAIAEDRVGLRASVVELIDYWHQIYDHNSDAIGPDPDLILPGQLLELPPTG